VHVQRQSLILVDILSADGNRGRNSARVEPKSAPKGKGGVPVVCFHRTAPLLLGQDLVRGACSGLILFSDRFSGSSVGDILNRCQQRCLGLCKKSLLTREGIPLFSKHGCGLAIFYRSRTCFAAAI